MENNYTIERILLGLQKEYLENMQKIDKLKEFCEVNDKKIFDYHFIPMVNYKNLILHYNKEYNKLSILLDKIKSMLKLYRRLDAIIIQNVDGEYKINNPKFPIQVKKENLLDFSDYIKAIMNSDFINYMNTLGIKLDKNKKLEIAPEFIDICHGYYSIMHYYAYNNIIDFRRQNGVIDNTYINNVLNLSISTSALNSYELDVINKSGTENQRIIISEEIKKEKKASFKISSHKDGLVLTRTR